MRTLNGGHFGIRRMTSPDNDKLTSQLSVALVLSLRGQRQSRFYGRFHGKFNAHLQATALIDPAGVI